RFLLDNRDRPVWPATLQFTCDGQPDNAGADDQVIIGPHKSANLPSPAGWLLISVLRQQHDVERLQDQLNVQPQSAMLDIIQVHIHHLLERQAVPSAHLPVAGAARYDALAQLVLARILRELPRQRRPGPDEAHIALQHIPELGQLVDAGLPDEASDLRNARVILHLEHRAFNLVLVEQLREQFLRIRYHRAEFVHIELSALQADSHLLEKNRPLRIRQLD